MNKTPADLSQVPTYRLVGGTLVRTKGYDPEGYVVGLENMSQVLPRNPQTIGRLIPDGPLSFIKKRVGLKLIVIAQSLSNALPLLIAHVSSGRAANGRASAEAQRQRKATSVSSGSGAQNVTKAIPED